jgi:hypothetical protein
MANPNPVTRGRKPGVPNKVTRDIKEICRGHGPAVIDGLLRLSKEADSDAAKIAASKEILGPGLRQGNPDDRRRQG